MKVTTLTAFLLVALSSLSAKANITISNYQCPVEFEGSVAKIETPKKDHSLAKIKVTFKNEYDIRGSKFEEKTVEILKHGMIQVEPGALYSVALRGDKVCDIRQI